MYLFDFLISPSLPPFHDGNSVALKLSSKAFIVFFYSSFIGKTCQWPIPSRQSQGVFQGQPSLPDSGDESWCTYWIYFIYISLWRRAKALHRNPYQLVWYQVFVIFFATDAELESFFRNWRIVTLFVIWLFCFVNSQNMKKIWAERRKRS